MIAQPRQLIDLNPPAKAGLENSAVSVSDSAISILGSCLRADHVVLFDQGYVQLVCSLICSAQRKVMKSCWMNCLMLCRARVC